MIKRIAEEIRNDLIGHECYVQGDNYKLIKCTITRIDLFCSTSGMGVNAHLKGPKGTTKTWPNCVNIYIPGEPRYNVSTLQYGYLTIEEYYNREGDK